MEFAPIIAQKLPSQDLLDVLKPNRVHTTDHTYIQTNESPEDRKKRFARERQRRRRAKLNTEQLTELREYDRHRHVIREFNETADEKRERRNRTREAVRRFRANESPPKKLIRQIKDAEGHTKYRPKSKEEIDGQNCNINSEILKFEDNRMSCAISTCPNIGCKNNITYFKFPTDSFLRIMWTDRSYRADNFNPNTSCICSAHFNEEDFESTSSNGQLRLKKGAIPSEKLIDKSARLIELKLPGKKIIDWNKIGESIVKARQRELFMTEVVDKPS